MRAYTRVWGILVWLATVLMLFLQLLVVFGMVLGKSEFDVTLIIIATVVMLVSVIAFFAMKKHKWVPLLLSLLASALFVVIAVMIADKFLAGSNWVDTRGFVTSWQLVYRHLSPLLIPLFMGGYLVCWRQRQRELAAAEAYVQKSEGSTIGVEQDETA